MDSTATNHLPDQDSTREYQERIFKALENLQPFPAVATNLLQLCQNSDQPIADLMKVIECDPVISLKILATANSPLYGHSRQISSIPHAVVVLGFRSVSKLAISFAAADVFTGKGAKSAEQMKNLFSHSLGCGTVARAIAESSDDVDSGSAFLTGVMHDVGKLILFEMADRPCDISDNESLAQVEIEMQTFGMSHPQIGMRCAERWGLPEEICAGIGFHHHPHDANQHQPIALVINQANSLAKQWGLIDTANGPPIQLDDEGECEFEHLRADAEIEFKSLMAACAAN